MRLEHGGGLGTTEVALQAGVTEELFWGNGGSRSLCRFGFPPFPFRVLNSVEQGSIHMGQTPAHCNNLCLSGTPRVAAHCFQIFCKFVRILHLFRGEVPKH